MSRNISQNDLSIPQLIANYQCQCGENPLWNTVDNRLYWCDIPNGNLYRFDPETHQHELCYQSGIIGGFTIEADGSLLLFMAGGEIRHWSKGAATTIVSGIPRESESRFNDVLADPLGRVFCGTMATPTQLGCLYRLDLDGSLTMMVDGIQCSNGIALSLDQRQMYYADSLAREIYIFDYDMKTGSLKNQRVFVHNDEADGLPDGITIDAVGYLWSAQWDGNCLIRYRPDGTEDRRIRFSTKKVSSLTFAGADGTDIYVTTAGGEATAENGELAGALFRLNVGIRGVPEFHSGITTSRST